MGKERDNKTTLVQSIIRYVRDNHKDTIEQAYRYFWDEDDPTEFLSQTALEMGFANFEDWLAIDYRANKERETFIDIFSKCTDTLTRDDLDLLAKLKDSVLSLYEVISVSKDKKVRVKDLLVEGEYDLRDKILSRGLKKGDIFATRLLRLDEKHVMSSCVYPFGSRLKKKVLELIDKQYKRYKKNVNPDGSMKDFLKDYGDLFNIIWVKLIVDTTHGRK
jgi:hypothetical protein